MFEGDFCPAEKDHIHRKTKTNEMWVEDISNRKRIRSEKKCVKIDAVVHGCGTLGTHVEVSAQRAGSMSGQRGKFVAVLHARHMAL